MAKIVNLTIDYDKIASEAITKFFTRTTATSITVNNPYGIPTIIWIKSAGAINVSRTGLGVIYTSASAVTTYVLDGNPPAGNATYTTSANEIIGAMVNLR